LAKIQGHPSFKLVKEKKKEVKASPVTEAPKKAPVKRKRRTKAQIAADGDENRSTQ